MKNILQRDNQKSVKKIQHKHIEKKRKKNEYIFKAKERNNIKTMVLKIYL